MYTHLWWRCHLETLNRRFARRRSSLRVCSVSWQEHLATTLPSVSFVPAPPSLVKVRVPFFPYTCKKNKNKNKKCTLSVLPFSTRCSSINFIIIIVIVNCYCHCYICIYVRLSSNFLYLVLVVASSWHTLSWEQRYSGVCDTWKKTKTKKSACERGVGVMQYTYLNICVCVCAVCMFCSMIDDAKPFKGNKKGGCYRNRPK